MVFVVQNLEREITTKNESLNVIVDSMLSEFKNL